MTTKRALVRRPGPLLADGEVSHIERTPVDVDLALEQWSKYCDAFREAGWDVVELPAGDAHPDAVFVEDDVFVLGELAVIARPGAASRRGEIDGLDAVFRDLGFDVATIEAPGTLEGGDLLKVASSVFAGRSARTDDEGIGQLRALLEPRGVTVTTVPVTKALHLKSCVTALPDGTFVGAESLVDRPEFFEAMRFMPEESGAHVVGLGENRALMAASCPVSTQRVADLGFEPITVDIGEFEKLEGCVTCLSVRLHDGVD